MSKTVTRKVPWSPDSWRVALRRRIEGASASQQPVLQTFANWLMEERGIVASTTWLHVNAIIPFLTTIGAHEAAPLSPALESLTADEVEKFFVQYGKDRGKWARRRMQNAMRLFLRFAARRGWVDEDLACAVPRVVIWRLSGLPRGLSDEELTKLLTSPWPPGECHRRDRAIVELLATYGVRRGQASALRLSDIDWRERTIDFASYKRGKAVHQTLTTPVARSLAAYLHEERPNTDCDYVFLRCRRPYLRLGPMAITRLVSRRMVKCGLVPRGPHALRHTFATRLLRAGQPIKVIADLLGHRSLSSVAIYAKVDTDRLLEVAMEWPEVLS